MNKKQVKGIARTAAKEEVKGHEKKMHAKGMKAGGPTTQDRLKYGRNVAKIMNQRSD